MQLVPCCSAQTHAAFSSLQLSSSGAAGTTTTARPRGSCGAEKVPHTTTTTSHGCCYSLCARNNNTRASSHDGCHETLRGNHVKAQATPKRSFVVWWEIEKWAGRELNSRPFGYQPNALTKLSYRPAQNLHERAFIKSFSGLPDYSLRATNTALGLSL